MIAFRVGIADAARLGRRFEPELAAANLRKAAELPCCRHHRPRLSRLGSGDIRNVARAEAAAAQRIGQTSRGGRRALAGARARIVRLIGERSVDIRPTA